MKTFDVVIIGGGTAGLFLARELGKMKRKTLIVERKTDLLNFTFNTLGSFINLEEFDLTENVVAQKIDTAIIYSKNFKRTLGVDVYILDKRKVHEELIAGIDQEYITILTGTHIKEIHKDINKMIKDNKIGEKIRDRFSC